MHYLKRFFVFNALLLGTLSSCGDMGGEMPKMALTAAGAAGGALIGSKLAPNNKTMGAVIGAGAGGLLGYTVGGQIGQKK
jgi:hypothetical protein